MADQRSFRDYAFAGLLIIVAVTACLILAPFIPALLWAMTLSILTWPIYARFKSTFAKVPKGLGDSIAALVTVLITLVVVLIPFLMIGAGLFVQVQSLGSGVGTASEGGMQGFLAQIDQGIKPLVQQLGAADFSLVKYVEEHQEDIVTNLRTPATTFAKSAVLTVVTIVVALLTQFFFLRDGWRMREPLIDLCPIPRDRTESLLHRLYDTAWAVFVGTVLVAIIQGAVMGTTFAAVGVPNSLILGVISFVLCIIPLLGSPFVYIPTGLLLLSQGKTKEAMIVFGVGFLIVSNIDNALKPFLIGGRVNLHPMIIFFSILGGVLLFGPIGVMAGPMVATILILMLEVVRERQQMKRVANVESGS